MIVAVVGKGGVGKTTVASLILRRLLESGETPVLAIDADPSNCLGHALGIAEGRTLADMRDELRTGAGRPLVRRERCSNPASQSTRTWR